MGDAPEVDAEEHNNLDLGNAVREPEEQFGMDQKLLMRETTNDPSRLKTLVCLERQEHDNMTDEYSSTRRNSQPDTGWFSMKIG